MQLQLKKDDFQIDLVAFEKAITPRTKGIVLNSPNNPSGAVYNTEIIEKITALLKAKSLEFGSPIYLISDEPYRELVWNNEEVPYLPCYYDNSIVCYSYSKSLSIPGERIGDIALSPTMQNRQEVFAAVCGAGAVGLRTAGISGRKPPSSSAPRTA